MHCGSTVGVGVDVDVGVLETGAVVVRAVARLPARVLGLREGEFFVRGPGWARGFDFFEVAVWVALDVLFGVHHLLVRFGVILSLLFVGRHDCGVWGGCCWW